MNKQSKLLSVALGSAAAATVLIFAAPAQAYVGPGAGLSLIGALWAVVVAVLAALFFVVMWPLRRMMKRRAAAQAGNNQAPDPSGVPK